MGLSFEINDFQTRAQDDLDQVITFFTVLASLREIAANLEQAAKDWP